MRKLRAEKTTLCFHQTPCFTHRLQHGLHDFVVKLDTKRVSLQNKKLFHFTADQS